MRPVPAALRAVLGLAVVTMAGGFGAPAAAEPRGGITVTADGVSFNRERAENEDVDEVVYMIRSLDDADNPFDVDWLREDLDDDDLDAGYHAFEEAWGEMPDGYCVVYVRLPDVGEWAEKPGSTACTSSPDVTPSSEATTGTSSPSPSPKKSASASPTPTPTRAVPPPSPSASPSPSPSPSPTPSESPHSPSPDPMTVQGEALTRSFSGELPELSTVQPAPDHDQGRGWMAVGLIVAAVTVTGTGAAVWWGQRRS